MRVIQHSDALSVRAISGTRIVFLAIDVKPAARAGLLGFAIGKLIDGNLIWLRGRKVFGSVVAHPDPKDDFPSNEHPIQSLIWSDFSAEPGATTTYRIQPMYGAPGAPVLGDAVDIAITTEAPEEGVHGIYFNRGAVASQAYAEIFDNKPPKNPDDPEDPAVKFLARGTLDAALAFIDRAAKGEALHVAAYEFTYTPILKALRAAAARGVDVRIVHEAGQEYDRDEKVLKDTSATTSARNAIERLGLDRQAGLRLIKRTNRRDIPHNKFIIWLVDGKPREVLTGSTNFTASGFIGQTNVIHIVRDAGVAASYLDYWNQLARDPKTVDLAKWSAARTPQDDLTQLTAAAGITPYFSPRPNDDMLNWYADRIGEAKETAMFTAAFGVNKLLAAQFAIDRDFVRFLLLEDAPNKDLKAKLSKDRDMMAAYGSLLGAYAQGKHTLPENSLDAWFLQEELFRKQGNIFFIHTKFLLIDPLGDNPLAMTGSANFSTNSLENNDENMLLIRGDTRVADIYVTEFDRIFRHFFARQSINQQIEHGDDGRAAKFLAEDNGWLDAYVKPGRIKTNRQRLFFPAWPN
jgi:phosphatidylserine/phosphatidylglycerophosphate/cardiolipin synthase-like enzyme